MQNNKNTRTLHLFYNLLRITALFFFCAFSVYVKRVMR